MFSLGNLISNNSMCRWLDYAKGWDVFLFNTVCIMRWSMLNIQVIKLKDRKLESLLLSLAILI